MLQTHSRPDMRVVRTVHALVQAFLVLPVVFLRDKEQGKEQGGEAKQKSRIKIVVALLQWL